MALTILHPGLYTTIQDLGRFGFQQYGVITSGAMDEQALRIANMLVANDANAACLEITLIGPTLIFTKPTLFAITGGNLQPELNGQPLMMWQPHVAKSGDVLQLSNARTGCRSYLALAGGIDVPVVLNSRSTYVRAQLGGLEGRLLKKRDVIEHAPLSRLQLTLLRELSDKRLAWHAFYPNLHTNAQEVTVRFTRGLEYDSFTKESITNFTKNHYRVTPQSDRMGCRMSGVALERQTTQELLSEAVAFGTIQVPPNGQPIILLADHQTTGGYPKIGQIISADLSLLAQLRPGAKVRFTEVTHAEAELRYLQNARHLALLAYTIKDQYKKLSAQ